MESDNQKKSLADQYLTQNKLGDDSSALNEGAKSDLAPLGLRTLSCLVDMVILSVIVSYVLNPAFKVAEGSILVPFLLNIVAEFFYAGYFYSAQSSTPGKMIFKLQVVKDSGAKLSFVDGGLRDGLGKLASGIILGIGYIMAFMRPDRHALHDLIFKTKVILKK